MLLKCKDWKIFWRRKRIQKCPIWLSYGNSRNVSQNPHFLKKCKEGTKENFLKIAKNVALDWKAQRHSGANGIILYLVCTYSAKTGKDFGAKGGSKSAQMAKLWQFKQGQANPHFLKKCKGGTKGNFSKITQKVAFALEAHKHSRANGIIL